MNTEDLRQKLNQIYSRENWLSILSFVFPQLQLIRAYEISDKPEFVNQFYQLGFVELADGMKLAVLELEVDSNINLPKNRIKLRQSTHKFIDDVEYQGVLAVYYSQHKKEYRFTFSAKEGVFENGKFVEKETAKNRYTYLLGESEVCRTAAKRFQMLSEMGSSMQIEDVKIAFSVEALNKDFYTKIQKAFYELLGGKTDKKDYDGSLKLPSVNRQTGSEIYKEFTVRLIGRLVFCWFLKHKKSESGVSLMPDSILSSDSVTENYYHTVLETLFFETLNKPVNERKNPLPDAEDIPFLNGGLFEPKLHDYYNRDEITDVSRHINTLQIPDSWIKEFFELLEQYNFTIDENSARDFQVSIDPEILGRIFENLLAELDPATGETARKQTGSFYTPREIVDYMVEESLVNYLSTHTTCEKDDLRKLFDDTTDKSPFGIANNKLITKAIGAIRILDPACGSGAFPVGSLQKCLDILRKTDPGNDTFLDSQIEKIESLNIQNKQLLNKMINRLEKAFDEESNEADYGRKLALIQNCIYGVDIQPIAIEICKLRFFLTLIVDEKVFDNEDNRGIEPLPNLGYKMMCGNSLVESFQGIDLSNTDKFMKIESLDEKKLVQGNLFTGKEDFGAQPIGTSNRRSMTYNHQAFVECKDDLDALQEEFYLCRNHEDKKQIVEEIESRLRGHLYYNLGLEREKLTEQKKVIKKKGKKKPFTAKDEKALEKIDDAQKNLNEKFNQLEFLVQQENQKEFFLWHFFFKEVFQQGGFDVVIGNPPYVQIQKLPKEVKTVYQNQKYDTFAATGDLYCLFYERGFQLLKEGGVLTYITSNQWMKTAYGKKLRNYFSTATQPLQLINLGADVFDGATVNTNILCSTTGSAKQAMEVCNLNRLNKEDFAKTVKSRSYDLLPPKNDSWVILTEFDQKIKSKIEAVGKPLKDWDIEINYGIKTGFNEAFIIDDATKQMLVEQDSKSAEIIKPILLGKDIKRYKINYNNLWVINSHNGYSCDGNVYDPIDVDDYSVIKEHLNQHEKQLRKRYDKGKTFYNLRNCAYVGSFENEKITWGNLSQHAQFALAPEEMLINAPSPFINSGSRYLLALLNSSIADMYIKFIGVERSGGFLEYKPMFVERFPIPEVDQVVETIFTRLVDYILFLKKIEEKLVESSFFEQIIDALVYELYFPEEIKSGGISFIDELQAYGLPDVSALTDLEKMPIIHQVFEDLYDKDHPIRRGIYFLDSIELVRHIKESLRK